MILVTGASGMVGSAVLRELQKLGKPVRAMYRSEQELQKAPAGAAVCLGDFADADSLKKAFQGVEALFLVCSPIPQLVELECNAIDAALSSGVKHIVLNSALGAGKYDKSFPSWHRQVEAKLASTSLRYTILRPNGFFQNLLTYNAPTILSQNAFYGATASAKMSILDVRDIAAAAARILATPEPHALRIYELNGPGAWNNAEIAALLSQILGRAIQYIDLPDEVFGKALQEAGLPAWQVQALLELQQYYRSGDCAEVTGVLEELLGRAPVSLDAFLSENRLAFLPQSAKA